MAGGEGDEGDEKGTEQGMEEGVRKGSGEKVDMPALHV